MTKFSLAREHTSRPQVTHCDNIMCSNRLPYNKRIYKKRVGKFMIRACSASCRDAVEMLLLKEVNK